MTGGSHFLFTHRCELATPPHGLKKNKQAQTCSSKMDKKEDDSPPSELVVREKGSSRLRSFISLNMDSGGASGSAWTQPLNPLSYQFLLRRSSAVIEEQIEVGSLCSSGQVASTK